MDRKKDWQNIEKAYNLITLGEEKKYKVPKRQYPGAYNKGLTDEFIPPSIVVKMETVELLMIMTLLYF